MHLRKTHFLTIANRVTIGRIAAIPLNLILLYLDRPIWAAVVFLLIALSDALDGYLARRLKQESDLGKFLDPLADKILVIATLVALVDLGMAPGLPVILIVARDFLVSAVRLVKSKEGVVVAASDLGKWKTVTQIIAVFMLMLGLPFAVPVLWLSVGLTLFSGWEYYKAWKR